MSNTPNIKSLLQGIQISALRILIITQRLVSQRLVSQRLVSQRNGVHHCSVYVIAVVLF
jgi:hypothetical protein